MGSGFDDSMRSYDAMRERFPIGSVITVTFTERTSKGSPRFPRFLRHRADWSLT